MFNIFRKNKHHKELKREATFSFSRMEENGKQYILTFKDNLLELAESRRYPFQIGIAVPLHTNNNGFPSKEENEQLLDMEHILERDFSHNDIAVFAGAIIGGGVKEYVFYTGKPTEARVVFEKLKKSIEHHELQGIVQDDHDWNVYKTYHPNNK